MREKESGGERRNERRKWRMEESKEEMVEINNDGKKKLWKEIMVKMMVEIDNGGKK